MHRHSLTQVCAALAFTILLTLALVHSALDGVAASQAGDSDGGVDGMEAWKELGFSRDPCDLIGDLGFDGARANESVSWQVSLGPRTVGSNASALLRSSMIENLTALGWNASEQPHDVTFANGSSAVAVNVVASLRPNASRVTPGGPRVVLAAHYDTRPTADYDPDPTLRGNPIDGANDGASGVAVLMELARVLPTADPSVEVVLLFTDVEDHGDPLEFLGARGWAQNQSDEEVARTRAFVLLDMIGDADLSIGAEPLNSDPALMSAMLAMGGPMAAHAERADCEGARSETPVISDLPSIGINDDHTAVRDLFPAALLIDVTYGPHDPSNPLGQHWHTTADTPDKVSAESLGLVGRMVELALRSGLGETMLPGDDRVAAAEVPDVGAYAPEADHPRSQRGLHVAVLTAILAFSIDLLVRRWRAVQRATKLDDAAVAEPAPAEDSQAADAPASMPEV